MSAQAKPFRIGLFVLGAAALLLVAIVVFGSGDLFRTKYRFVSYFPGSVAGLQLGAKVAFRGVPIGRVTGISIELDPDAQQARVPVSFEILQGAVDTDGRISPENLAEELGPLIEAGLRARLTPESFVTGQLYVELLLEPETDAKLFLPSDAENTIEIPAIESTIDVLETQIESLFGSGQDGGPTLISRLEKLANDDNIATFGRILKNVDTFTAGLDTTRGKLDGVLDKAEDAVAKVDRAIPNAELVIDDVRETVRSIGSVADELRDPEAGVVALVASLRDAAGSVQRMADQINNAVAENRPGLRDFTEGTLPSVSDLAFDLERFAQTLNRIAAQLEGDPAGFIFGRGSREGIR